MRALFKFTQLKNSLQALLVLAIFCLSACSNNVSQLPDSYLTQSDDGKASIGDIHHTKYIFSNNSTVSLKIAYRATIAQTIKTPIDVLILFDRTASMEKFIHTTANAAEKIVGDVQSIAPDTRFAVAAVSDYSPLFTDDADKRTWLLLTNFTYKAAAVKTASKSIQLTNGGDTPEAYVRGFYEASEMGWRKEAKKIIIFFGDATSHEQDPGRDETMGSADDLEINTVLATLKAKNIAVIAIHTRNDSDVVAEFNRVGNGTSGKTVPLSNASESSKVIKDSISEALADPPNLHASGEYASWINATNTGKASQNNIDYAVQITPPAGTSAGVYDIPLSLVSGKVKSGQLIDAFIGKPFEIKVITGWINHPLLPWLPLILLLLFLLTSAFMMMRGGYSHAKHVTSKRGYNADSYSLPHLLLDALTLASLLSTAMAIYLCATSQVLSQLLNSLHLL